MLLLLFIGLPNSDVSVVFYSTHHTATHFFSTSGLTLLLIIEVNMKLSSSFLNLGSIEGRIEATYLNNLKTSIGKD